MKCRLVFCVALLAGLCMPLWGCRPEKPSVQKAKAEKKERKIESKADVGKARSVQQILREKDGAQVVEGFAEIVVPINYEDRYPDYRGVSEAWLEISHGKEGGEELTWKTAPPPGKKKTIFVFTASNGEDEGDIDLSVNGKKVLTFSSGVKENRTWKKGEYSLDYLHKAHVAGYSGIYSLTVPAEAIEAREPIDITVRHTRGEKNAWFRLKGYRDTAKYEKLK